MGDDNLTTTWLIFSTVLSVVLALAVGFLAGKLYTMGQLSTADLKAFLSRSRARDRASAHGMGMGSRETTVVSNEERDSEEEEEEAIDEWSVGSSRNAKYAPVRRARSLQLPPPSAIKKRPSHPHLSQEEKHAPRDSSPMERPDIPGPLEPMSEPAMLRHSRTVNLPVSDAPFPPTASPHRSPIQSHLSEQFKHIADGVANYPNVGARVTDVRHALNLMRGSTREGRESTDSSQQDLHPPSYDYSADMDEKIGPPPEIDPKDMTVANESQLITDGPHRPRAVVVVYRLPLTLSKQHGKWEVQWADITNVYANLRVLEDTHDVHFVGWPGFHVPEEEQDELEDFLLSLRHPVHPVFLPEEVRNNFEDKFCKDILFQLFHYAMPANREKFGKDFEALWRAYQNVNMTYAKKACVATDKEEDACIWFHSYYLLIAPNFVRRQIPTAQIGLFVHTVFPTSEVFRCIPTRQEILRGMLSADLIGFHTYDYARHFLSSCKRALDLDFHTLPDDGTLVVHILGRDVSLRISHVGVRSEAIRDVALSTEVSDIANDYWRRKLGPKRVIFVQGEYSRRGTLLNVEAIEMFFKQYPQWVSEVVFVVQVRARKYKEEVERENRVLIMREVESINVQYDEKIVHLVDEWLDYKQLVALYAICDVALFGKLWDGFNTVPYEVTAAQSNTQSQAVLIVSEFLGCMRSLGGVLRVNPWKLSDVSRAFHEALVMTAEERSVAHSHRYRHVMHSTFTRWARNFLRDLVRASEAENNKVVLAVGFGSRMKWVYLEKDFVELKEVERLLVQSYRNASKRVLLFDYGGTLAAIDESSDHVSYHARSSSDLMSISNQLARISPTVMAYLQMLARDPNSIVAVISGHTMREINRAFAGPSGDGEGSEDLCLTAEKGAFYRWPGHKEWERNPNLIDCRWKTVALELLENYQERTDGSFIQEKDTALVWHYKGSDPDYGEMQAVELERYLRRIMQPYHSITVQKYDHERVLEILPKDVHKGKAALAIVERMIDSMEPSVASVRTGRDAGAVDTNDVFILAVGNDRSDEKMFKSVELAAKQLGTEHVYSCTIGLQPSQARFYLAEQKDINWLLHTLVGACRFRKRSADSATQPVSPAGRRGSGSGGSVPSLDLNRVQSFGAFSGRRRHNTVGGGMLGRVGGMSMAGSLRRRKGFGNSTGNLQELRAMHTPKDQQ